MLRDFWIPHKMLMNAWWRWRRVRKYESYRPSIRNPRRTLAQKLPNCSLGSHDFFSLPHTAASEIEKSKLHFPVWIILARLFASHWPHISERCEWCNGESGKVKSYYPWIDCRGFLALTGDSARPVVARIEVSCRGFLLHNSINIKFNDKVISVRPDEKGEEEKRCRIDEKRAAFLSHPASVPKCQRQTAIYHPLHHQFHKS